MWYSAYLIKAALHGPWNVRPASMRMKRQGMMENGSQRGRKAAVKPETTASLGYPYTGSVSGGNGGSTYA